MIYDAKEDSFLLAEVVKKYASGKHVLDVGTGSGIQMEVALSVGASSVQGVDKNPESVEFCREKGLDVVESDLFSEIEGVFDLVIFNPPYLPRDEREDLESAEITSGGEKGDELIVKFFRNVGQCLAEEGKILLVVSSLTPTDRILEVLDEKGFVKKVVASEKLFMEGLEVWEISRKGKF